MSSRQKQRQVEDPGEFNQRRRLRAINDARAQARDVYTTAEAGISEFEDEAAAVFAAVKAYALELEWLMAKHGDDVYRNADLGTIKIPVPEELEELAGHPSRGGGSVGNGARLIGERDFEPYTLSVTGLIPAEDTSGAAFLDLPREVSHTWTAQIDERHKRPQARTFTDSTTVPVHISVNAMRICNSFLEESGLDARIEAEVDQDPNPY